MNAAVFIPEHEERGSGNTESAGGTYPRMIRNS